MIYYENREIKEWNNTPIAAGNDTFQMSSILKKVIQGIKERHKSELGKLSDKLIREKVDLRRKHSSIKVSQIK